MYIAASNNKIAKVLKWLGPKPIPKKRLDGKTSNNMGITLLDAATYEGRTDLMHILLQYGADVDPKTLAYGETPLSMACCTIRLEAAGRLLLEWGAEIRDSFVSIAHNAGNMKLANLMSSPLGGRRCEIVGFPGHNGRTCVTRRYFDEAGGKYSVKMEGKDGKIVKIKAEDLKRRDRTPEDPGYIFEFVKFNGHENVVTMEWVNRPVISA